MSAIKYPKPTKDLALVSGQTVSRLLWKKILASVTPEVREMLVVHYGLNSAVFQIIPEEVGDEYLVTHEKLVQVLDKAEALLIGGQNV